MPRFLPFRPLHANSDKNVADLVTPPFDELSMLVRQERAARHRLNFVRFESARELPGEDEEVEAADRHRLAIEQARAEKSIRDGEIGYCLLQVTAGDLDLIGFVGMLELKAIYRPSSFETPLKADVDDRFEQLRSTSVQTAPITIGYHTTDENAHQIDSIMARVRRTKPFLEFEYPEGTRHRLWHVDAEEYPLEPLLSKKSMVILDGADRYEAAMRYSAQMRLEDAKPSAFQAYNFILTWMVDLERQPIEFRARHWAVRAGAAPHTDGATILTKLEDYFEIERYKLTKPGAKEAELVNLLDEMDIVGKLNHTYGLYIGDKAYYLLYLRDAESYERMFPLKQSRRWKRLDVCVLQSLVFDGILGLGWENPDHLEKFSFPFTPARAVSLVDDGFADAVFLLNPPVTEHLIEIASSSEPIPARCVMLARRPLVGPVMVALGLDDQVGDDLVKHHKASRPAAPAKIRKAKPVSRKRTPSRVKPAPKKKRR